SIHAIMFFVPLPEHIPLREAFCSILPDKEVEGFHPDNLKNYLDVSSYNPELKLACPLSVKVIKHLFDFYDINYEEADIVFMMDSETMEIVPAMAQIVRHCIPMTISYKSAYTMIT